MSAGFAGLGVRVVVRRAGLTPDPYGNESRSWAPDAVTQTVVDGVVVAPRTVGVPGEVPQPGRPDAVSDGVTLYLPPGADVRAQDRVEVAGVLYEVDGQPSVWSDPWRGEGVGVEVRAVRLEG